MLIPFDCATLSSWDSRFGGQLRCSNVPAREPENPIIMPPVAMIVQHAPVVAEGATDEAVAAGLRVAALF